MLRVRKERVTRSPIGRHRIGRHFGSRTVAFIATVFAMLLANLGLGAVPSFAAKALPAPKACNTAGAPKCYGTANFPVTNYVKYVGGHAGPANPKLAPISIGWVNQQGGTDDIAPETTVGAQVAVKWLNTYGGGIGGHPVKLVTCYIPDTVSSAQQCGQEFANNKSVSAVAMGAVAVGNQSFEQALAPTHKTIAFLISLANVDDSYKPGYALYGDNTHILAPYATFAKNVLHAKRVAVIYENGPGASLGPDIIVDALKHVGIKTSIVGFDPTTTDLTTPLTAAGVQNADMVISTVGGTDCSNLYKAMQELGLTKKVKVGVFGPCASSQVQTADGGKLPPGWYYASANSAYQDPADPDGPAFYKVTKLFGDTQYAADPWVTDGFGQIITVAKWMTEAGPDHITPKTVAAEAAKFKGPIPFGAQHLVCGQFKNAPAACNDKSTLYFDVNGVFHAVDRWVGPPKGFQVPAG